MKWSNGFHLGRRLVKLWRCLKRPRPFSYSRRLLPPEEDEEEIHQRLWTGGGGCRGHGRVRRRLLLYRGKKGGELGGRRTDVPRGHLAVYVGVKDPEHRFLVPVIYMNHPFFRRLLKVTEEEYGFDHKGGITIPCGVADFESVKRSIDEEDAGHRARKETVIHRLFHIHPF